MSVVQIIGTNLGINQLVQSLVLTPSSNYNGDVTIDFTIRLYPETSSNDTYSSSFTLYVRPVDEDPRLIVSPTAAAASIRYSNSLPSISVFDPDFLSACRSEFVGDAADKMSISISLTVDSGYLLVPVLHDLYDGFYVPVSWQRRQKTVLLSGFPPLVNAVLSNIKYLVDGSLKREDSLLINWVVVNTTEVKIPLASHENVFDTVLVTPSSQGVAIRTQEDCPWAFDNKLIRLNAYSNASYEVILTSEIGSIQSSMFHQELWKLYSSQSRFCRLC